MYKAVFLLILFPLIGYAQASYIIKGFGKGFKEGDRIFLLYKEPGMSASTADSTQVKNGAFEFKGTITNIVTGGIYRNINPVYTNEVQDSFSFYVEPGNIIMQSPDTLSNMVVTGTPLNDDYMKLITELKPLTSSQITPAKFNFIKRNTNSYVSLTTLNALSKNPKLLPEVEQALALLSPALKAKPMAQDIIRRIEFAKKITLGMMAKDFAQRDVNGKMIKLSAYQGQYVLVDFWASWCLPCREENPNVISAYQRYQTKGFTVLGVSLDDKNGKAAWLKAIKDDGLLWTNVSDLNGWKNEAAVLYGITAIPANILIDPNGKIIAKDLKGKSLNEKLASIFGD